MRLLLIFALNLFPLSLLAANSSYDCKQVADTSVSWSLGRQEYTADAKKEIEDGILVKLIDLNTNNPKLAGQSIAELTAVASSNRHLVFVEITPAGTVVTWTLFLANESSGQPNAILISSKSYEFMGPVNFTTLFECA